MVSLVVILIGFITFNVVPTPANPTDSSSSSSLSEEDYHDNSVVTDCGFARREAAVVIPAEVKAEEDEEELRQACWEIKKRKTSTLGSSQKVHDEEPVVEHSTKL